MSEILYKPFIFISTNVIKNFLQFSFVSILAVFCYHMVALTMYFCCHENWKMCGWSRHVSNLSTTISVQWNGNASWN